MKPIAILAVACGLFLATSPALAEQRVCMGAISGPAGTHVIRLLQTDGVIERGIATWSPTNQIATSVRRFTPTLNLYYRVTDPNTGALGALYAVEARVAASMTNTRATEATVRLRRYGESDWAAEGPWRYFSQARAEMDDGGDMTSSISGSVMFSDRDTLALAGTAPQIETQAYSNLDEVLSSGVFNLSYRVANDALFERAFQTAMSQSTQRRCERPDNTSRSLFRLQD